MDTDFDKIWLTLAQKDNNIHKKRIWEIFNENIEFFHQTSKKVPYEDHCKWWIEIFDKEYIYIIMYKSDICGYIRLTKEKTEFKDKHEISIGLSKIFQNFGIGSYAYHLFEVEMKLLGISEIIAKTELKNLGGQRFFQKNGFKDILIISKKKI
jgi:RimJ/RimL family protein N-acetyltransferase